MADIPAAQRQDPTFFRTGGAEIGRDGCRVPLPWTHVVGVLRLRGAARTCRSRHGSPRTPSTSRMPIRPRASPCTGERCGCADGCSRASSWSGSTTGRADVLRVVRPNGWRIITNFGTEPFELGRDAAAAAVLSSRPLDGTALPGEATVWLAAPTMEQ